MFVLSVPQNLQIECVPRNRPIHTIFKDSQGPTVSLWIACRQLFIGHHISPQQLDMYRNALLMILLTIGFILWRKIATDKFNIDYCINNSHTVLIGMF